VWDVGTGRLLYALEGHTNTVRYAEFSADASQILTASWDGTARVWDARTGQLSHALEHAEPVYSARFSPDGSRVITVSGDKIVKVWDAHTGQELHTL
jgi:WD40 repeat protein